MVVSGCSSQRLAGATQRLQGVNATNRIFILRVGPCLATLAARQKVSVRARYNNMERVNSVGAVGDINIFDEKFKASVGLGGF